MCTLYYLEGDSSKVHNLSRPIQKLIECGLIERLDRGQGRVVQNFRIRLPEFCALNFLKANEFLEGSKYNSVLPPLTTRSSSASCLQLQQLANILRFGGAEL